jgi:hypothetical protein
MAPLGSVAVIQEMRPTHDGVLDLVLANPHMTLRELSARTGYSIGWLSQLMRSDCFRAAYDGRRNDVESECMLAITERLEGIAHLALDKMQEALTKSNDPDFVLDAFDKVMHRAGYAPKAKEAAPGTVNIQQNNYVASKEELAQLRGTIVQGTLIPSPEPAALPNAAEST